MVVINRTLLNLVASAAVVGLVVVGCSDSGSGSGPDFVAPPVLTPSPNPDAPLAAVVRSQTDKPAIIRITIDDGESARTVIPDEVPRTDHETPVLGLRPAHEYTVRVEALDEAGNVAAASEELMATAPPLPDGFPPITVVQPAVDGSVESGVTMFGASFSTDADPVPKSYLVIVDGQGEVVWYLDPGTGISDVRRLLNGNLLFLQGGNRGLREIDMLGNTVGEWTATGFDDRIDPGAVAVDVDSFHHEVVELPEDDEADFLVLSSELRTFPDYPTSEAETFTTESRQVMADVVVAFRRDGTVVERWSLLDILDPNRISYDSLDTEWKLVYGEEDTSDWGHGNAVVVDPADGGIVVSLRNQDAVVKFARDTGELIWILGPHGRWEDPWRDALLTPAAASASDTGSAFEWNYHQHAPMFTSDGGLLLFDNGNARAIPPDPELDTEERYSRVVEYRIDEASHVVSQTWAYGGPDDPWYSGALGDADLLPLTGNVLTVDGFETPTEGARYARVFEVTRTEPAQIVWEVDVHDETGDPPLNWTVYRAERLPSVYP